MAPAVRFHQAVALLGRFPALAGVDLDVAAGQIVLLRGPNGAGKTTLLRASAGLVPITSGSLEVLGHDLVTDPRSVRRRVGYAGTGAGLYDDLTVAGNVTFWTRAAGVAAEAGAEAMAHLEVDGRLADVAVAQLSTGQRKRALLAALVARRPELWLLDEPHAGLDEAGRDLVDELLRRAAAAGATVLFASHELDRAAGVATREVTIVGGIVVDDHPPEGNPVAAAVHRPANTPYRSAEVPVVR